MRSVLVTGANGALGQAVIARLRSLENFRVIATVRHPLEENDIQLDVLDHEQIFSIIQSTEPSLVLHLAATFSNDYEAAFSVNVEATRHLLETIRQLGFRTRVLLVGSAAEYGVVQPAENPIREDHALNPVSIYGLTKAWQTQLAGFYASLGVDVVVARVFNLDGLGLSERLFVGRLQSQLDEVVVGRKSVIKIGPLTAIRDYISTREAAIQLLAIAERGEVGHVYHVASGLPVTMREILHRYLIYHNLPGSIICESLEHSNRIGYDVPEIYADITNTLQLMKASEFHFA